MVDSLVHEFPPPIFQKKKQQTFSKCLRFIRAQSPLPWTPKFVKDVQLITSTLNRIQEPQLDHSMQCSDKMHCTFVYHQAPFLSGNQAADRLA